MKKKNLGALSILCLALLTVAACSQEKVRAQQTSDTTTEREFFTVVAEQPSYNGGVDALYRSLMSEVRYPLEARQSGIEGRVWLAFDIERNGTLSNIEVAKGIGGGCGAAAMKALKSAPSFIAGSQRGRTVRTHMSLPFTFSLDPSKTNPDKSPQGSIVIGELQVKKELIQVNASYKDGAWTGTLKDNEGHPLPGANIIVEETPYGRVSGLDGAFSVQATQAQNVVISFVGYEDVRLEPKGG